MLASRGGGLPDVVEGARRRLPVPLKSWFRGAIARLRPAVGAGRAACEKLDWKEIAREMMSEYARCGDERAGDNVRVLRRDTLTEIGRSTPSER